MRKIVFDIETKNIFQDVGSRNPEDLDISVVGLYDFETNKYYTFLQEEFDAMWEIFKKADLMITFNGEYFDIPLLNKYYKKAGLGDLKQIRSLDIFKEIKQTSGRWLKLDKIAMGTFGINKSGDGLEAVKWWREGKGPEFTNLAKDEISRILRTSRNVKEGETNDFRVTSSDEALGIVTQITNVLTLFLTAIAAISLLVGGIGIMNIMFVTVSERTKEIGLRKAIGAKNNDILLQFLIEAVVVTVLGGAIGLVMGILTTALIASVANIPNVVSLESIALALGVSITIGLVFGIYPARKASKLNPIDALRFE
jgi:ABC-type antimicrobial peptide transport system permease subunit